MSEPRIDVQVEHRHAAPPAEEKHPNTCPKCGSHYRDDELEAALWVCGHCGHHFPMRGDSWIALLADAGSWHERWADIRPHDLLVWVQPKSYRATLQRCAFSLLVVTPDQPIGQWTHWGFEAAG